jgi:hypothetical protein
MIVKSGAAAAPPHAVSFKATLTCPIVGPGSQGNSFAIAGGACATLAPNSLTILQHQCTWKGLEFNGVPVVNSVFTGIGDFINGVINANGYDCGKLSDGSGAYTARWEETASAAAGWVGFWRIISGSGSLEGLSGLAAFTEEMPKPGAKVAVAILRGWYVLPPQPQSSAPKQSATKKRAKKN